MTYFAVQQKLTHCAATIFQFKKGKKKITVKKKKKGTKAVEAGGVSGKAESAHLGVYSAVSEGSAEILLTLNRIHMAKSGCPPQGD